MKGLHWVDLGQWPHPLVITFDRNAYNAFMRKKQGSEFGAFPPKNGGRCELMRDGDGACYIMIAIGQSDDLIEVAATLAHEAAHATRFLLEDVGETEPGKETEAYLVEHIVRHGLRHFGTRLVAAERKSRRNRTKPVAGRK